MVSMVRYFMEIDVKCILVFIESWRYDFKWDLLVKVCEIDFGIKMI